jgi:arabinan endo-1,5-alpha-L-arabinosidase
MVLQSSTNVVKTERYLARDYQKWTITPAGHGFYEINSASDTNCLEAAGAAVDIAPFTGADNQLWKIDQLADGSHRIASKIDKLALTAAFKSKPGNGVALQPFTGDDAQRWVIDAP